ncbi:MAG: helix-turn-helix domain-containing protein [Candidatus Nanopelagicales bacterium]|nr:helix-turn-helix domain-containing protein [Candidatus Nanopelagicales bacterium]
MKGQLETTLADVEPLLSVTAVAAVLDLPLSTVYGLARTGEIPCVKIGRAVRFSPAAIRSWLAERSGP